MSLNAPAARAGRFLNVSGPPRFQSVALAALPGVRHGFFGRAGGVSEGVYSSLNAGPGSRDAPEAVAENRRRIAAAMGVASERLVSLHQVHSATAVRIDGPWRGARPEADALVTTEKGLALTALAADCAPVLLVDAQAGVIGAAHSGWRGALGGVLEAVVSTMQAAGGEPKRIVAAIGPCIRQPSYEVGPDFEVQFLQVDQGAARFFKPGSKSREKRQFDLPGYVGARLEAAGVGRLETLAIDTYSEDAALFSHRRNTHDGASDYGRNCAAIVLDP
ncbi:MAG: peptidoglycan editing factor PgeF [Alphaproteobacteria bacterium]|nr:peptidoglycan editing factor PgeF [Alphaproteobacteria bacterium]